MAIRFRWGVTIPLRDGVHLNATVYLPQNQRAAAPAILVLTPYISDVHHADGMYFATHGNPFVVVDSRGRGNSQGEFRAFIQEAKDGHDVIEWLARQPYSDGKVAMWGGSYSGYAQWAAAKEFPPHLATIVPTAAPCLGTDFPMRNNIFYPFVIQWITLTRGRVAQVKILSDSAFWSDLYREWFQSGRAFCELDSLLGNPSRLFREWLSHPHQDAYWDAHNPTADEYARIAIPILTITGNYDDDQRGALEHYRQHMRWASPEARARHYLIIGPWDHAGTQAPQVNFGGLTVAEGGALDLSKLHLEWYAWTMQAGRKPAFLRKPVAYYVMGAERWRYADTLEGATARYASYFLDSAGYAHDVFLSGSLGVTPGTGRPDTYTYDPRNTKGAEVDAEVRSQGGSLVDQRLALALHGKQLVYHSAPFSADTEITGFFKLSAWIDIDCPDTDLYVSIHEIGLDGGSIRLSTDAIRARYREGLRTPKLIRTREPLLYDFERFTFISRQVKQGHRLRLIIAPIGRLIDTTFVQKNFNSGGVVAEESVQDARAVTVSLFHDCAHPSVLHVPLGWAESEGERGAMDSPSVSLPGHEDTKWNR